MEKRQAKLVAPDGGYGWVATFGVSLVNVSYPSRLFQFTALARFLIKLFFFYSSPRAPSNHHLASYLVICCMTSMSALPVLRSLLVCLIS